jgi:hypothetical protein
MKNNPLIIVLFIFIAILTGSLILNISHNFAFVLVSSEEHGGENFILQRASVVLTEEDISKLILESEEIISEMKKNNLPVIYAEDLLIEAKRVFEEVKYAEILKNTNSSEEKKREARIFLRLIDWKNLSYSNVANYTREIKNRREQALLLFDQLTVQENKASGNLSTKTHFLLEQAKKAFYEDRFEDANILIGQFKSSSEQEKVQTIFYQDLQEGAKNFFQKYWKFILGILLFGFIAGYFVYRRLQKRILSKKIKKMQVEKTILLDFIKKTQDERFNENKLSALVYNIRIKKYKERLDEINQQLPVLENRLKISKE